MVRAVVVAVAPEETPYFDVLSAAFFDDPARALDPDRRPPRPLEWGITGVEGFATTVVLMAVTQVFSHAIQDAVARGAQGGRRWWRARKQRVDGPAVLNAEAPPLTDESARETADKAARYALDIHFSAETAEKIRVTVFVTLTGETDGADPRP